MRKGRPDSYSRITSQQKFMLRRLIMKDQLSVKQAASSLGINYSTAKTIMFFYRKKSQNTNSFSPSLSPTISSIHTATYTEGLPSKKIEIYFSIGKSQQKTISTPSSLSACASRSSHSPFQMQSNNKVKFQDQS